MINVVLFLRIRKVLCKLWLKQCLLWPNIKEDVNKNKGACWKDVLSYNILAKKKLKHLQNEDAENMQKKFWR